MWVVAATAMSVVVPVLSSGVGFARTFGHHLWWTLVWIAIWRAVDRFGLVPIGVGIMAVLAIGMLIRRRPGVKERRKRHERIGTES